MPQFKTSNFKTTEDVYAVVKADGSNTFACPFPECKGNDRIPGKKRFGRHLAINHKIPSAKHNGVPEIPKKAKGKKGVSFPTLLTKFCPNCGADIEQHEHAMILLQRGGK